MSGVGRRVGGPIEQTAAESAPAGGDDGAEDPAVAAPTLETLDESTDRGGAGVGGSDRRGVVETSGFGSAEEPGAEPVVVRYEKKQPGEPLHLDTKRLSRIQGIGRQIHEGRRTRKRGTGWEVLHVCVDDATRKAHAEAEVRPGKKGETARTS